jgi:hypothetical protein
MLSKQHRLYNIKQIDQCKLGRIWKQAVMKRTTSFLAMMVISRWPIVVSVADHVLSTVKIL